MRAAPARVWGPHLSGLDPGQCHPCMEPSCLLGGPFTVLCQPAIWGSFLAPSFPSPHIELVTTETSLIHLLSIPRIIHFSPSSPQSRHSELVPTQGSCLTLTLLGQHSPTRSGPSDEWSSLLTPLLQTFHNRPLRIQSKISALQWGFWIGSYLPFKVLSFPTRPLPGLLPINSVDHSKLLEHVTLPFLPLGRGTGRSLYLERTYL